MTKQRILILGMGRSGCAAAKLLLGRGAHVTGADARMVTLQSSDELIALVQQGLLAVADNAVGDVTAFDTIVCSPGITPQHPVLEQARAQNVPCIGEIELALRCLPSQQTLLGITGTNGKTTVTLMVTHVLNACGIAAKAVGNVGVALCGEIDQVNPNEVLVVELSSYQLEPLHLPVLDAAVILNITPDHLDRHGTMLGYARAKFQIGHCLKPSGKLFVQAEAAQLFPEASQGVVFDVYGGHSDHDIENQQAAALLCSTQGVTAAQFQHAVASFCKPPHRIEFVRRYANVDYYNDSKGTNLEAVLKAVGAMPGKIVLVAGGVDKGFSYLPWLPAFRGKVHAIYAIGQAAPKMQQELGSEIPVHLAASLHDAVMHAAAAAQPNDSVLLSPGCASFDMFRDYAHRGDEFKKIVSDLEVVLDVVQRRRSE